MTMTIKCEDGKTRCKWSAITPEFITYHDEEWGFPVKDDYRLFEKLALEGFQSGLSSRTILAKRENFRKAFKNFDFNKIARFTPEDVNRLLQDEGIVRHRGKIEAVINNAKLAKKLAQEHGSFASYIWSFGPVPQKKTAPLIASTSPESIAMSKELKKQGWKFIGPTTIYAFMQAMGLINDHAKACIIREKVTQAQKKFKKP